jgi:ferredoxin
MLPWRTTIDTRLRWLQFRINHFILPTNQWLCKIKIIDNSYCTRCKVHVESLDHILFRNLARDSVRSQLRMRRHNRCVHVCAETALEFTPRINSVF